MTEDPLPLPLLAVDNFDRGDLGWATRFGVVKAEPLDPTMEAFPVVALEPVKARHWGKFAERGRT